MKKISIHIGINYVGTSAELGGCINDAYDWEEYFSKQGFRSLIITEDAAIKSNIIEQIIIAVNDSKKGDILVVTYSGHGTQVPDLNGDEKDAKDEALVPYDYMQGRVIYDDELNFLFAQTEARVVFISDSCHSGSITRYMPFTIDAPGALSDTKARFIEMPKNIHVRPSYKKDMKTNAFLYSGCDDTEYSYDATIDGRKNGALSRTMLNILNYPKPPKTYKDLAADIRKKLPSQEFPQTPQFLRPKKYYSDSANKKLWT